MKTKPHHRKLVLAFFLSLPLTQHVFSAEVGDLKLQANVKRECVIEIPSAIELLDISSSNLINNKPGVTVGRPEKFDISVDCGADVDPSNVVMLALEPFVLDGDCLGMNETPKQIQLCLQHRDEDILFVEGEKYYIPVLNNYRMPALNEQDSAVKLNFIATPKVGQDIAEGVTEGEYTILLNINLHFQ